MYAVVEIAGKQYKVTEKDKLLVPTLNEKAGAKVKFNRVLLLGGEKDVTIGHPVVAGASVHATVLDHVKGEKDVVFKKKRRKGFRLKRGHRQAYTKIEITGIGK